jgi:hypothetical protein
MWTWWCSSTPRTSNVPTPPSAASVIGPSFPCRRRSSPIFVAEPFDFDREHQDALVNPLGSVDVRFVSIRTLIAMKEVAGRPQDKSEATTCARGWKMATQSDPRSDDIDWSLTTWEGARREQMRRWSELPLERIILALEEMEELAKRLMP